MLDINLAWISKQAAKWRPARWRVVHKLIEGLTQTQVGVALGIERQAVNDHVRKGDIRFVLDSGKQIETALTQAMHST